MDDDIGKALNEKTPGPLDDSLGIGKWPPRWLICVTSLCILLGIGLLVCGIGQEPQAELTVSRPDLLPQDQGREVCINQKTYRLITVDRASRSATIKAAHWIGGIGPQKSCPKGIFYLTDPVFDGPSCSTTSDKGKVIRWAVRADGNCYQEDQPK